MREISKDVFLFLFFPVLSFFFPAMFQSLVQPVLQQVIPVLPFSYFQTSLLSACMEDEVKERKRNPLTLPSSPFFFWKLAFVKLLGAAPVSPTAARPLFIGKGLKSNWPYSCTARPLPALMLHNTRGCRDWGMRVIQERGRKWQKSTEGRLDQINRQQLKCKHFMYFKPHIPFSVCPHLKVSIWLLYIHGFLKVFNLTPLPIWCLNLALVLLSLTSSCSLVMRWLVFLFCTSRWIPVS